MTQAIQNLRRIARLASKTKGMVTTAADLMAVDNILYLATDTADRLAAQQPETKNPKPETFPRHD